MMQKTYLNAQLAAETLDALIPGETVSYWLAVLEDARLHPRPAPFNLPVVDTPEGTRYALADLYRLSDALRGAEAAEPRPETV